MYLLGVVLLFGVVNFLGFMFIVVFEGESYLFILVVFLSDVVFMFKILLMVGLFEKNF